MNNYYGGVRTDILDFVPNKQFPNILEIGGGEFETLEVLKKLHKSCAWGVDIRQPTRLVNIDELLIGSIEDKVFRSSIPIDKFDLIIANDVIEHIVDTEDFLSFIWSRLNSSGLLILSVPNIRQIRGFYNIYLKGEFPRDDQGLFDSTHLRWFCYKDILKMALANNYTLVDHKYSGRFVPKILERNTISEFLALHNFLIIKKNVV